MDVVTAEKGEIMPPGTPRHITPEPSNHEPAMYYPRPSSERSQDVSHILASTFRDLYTRDVMGKDIVKNLTTSSDGSSEFHKKCMRQLKEAHEEHNRRLEEYTMLEKHIIQARARATSADERALQHAANASSPQKYRELGLPPVKSNFRWCLEEELLKKHNLIVPSDFLPKSRSMVDGPKPPKKPHFSIPTVTSSLHLMKGPVDDGYTSIEDLQAQEELKFQEEDEESMTTLSTNSPELLSSPPRTVIQGHKSKTVVERERKDRWRENMSHDQRVTDRAELARLEERHNFLKNPRYLPLNVPKASKLLIKEQPKRFVVKAGRTVAEDICQEDPIQIFMAKPSVVLFTEWNVGRIYEAVLELKNVSFVSRQLRVIPPTTSFFSVGLGKYPGVHGLVAPGMSAQFNIRFMPDSLADYDDFITVVSQADEPLKVFLKAERHPPILTVPHNLQCGHCLVGGTKVTDLVVKNHGGSGRFCVLKKTSWPAANFKTVVSPGSLEAGVFQVRPAVFELLAGQTMVLELAFSPTSTDKFREDLVMVCDNCQVQSLTIEGEGQAAAVELVSVSDGGEDQRRLGDISDLTADHLIRFPPLNPHSFYMKQILIHNSINVEMPYTWHILKPNLQTSLRPDAPNLLDRFEFYPDESPSFFIEPQSGTLQPNGIHEFVVTFAPHVVGNYQNVLHLVLSNIPEAPPEDKSKAQKLNVHSSVQESAPSQHVGRKSSLPGGIGASTPLSKREEPARPNKPTTNLVSSNPKTGGSHLREVIALEIELKGDSIPYSVILHPPAIIIPGSVPEGTTVKRPFKMANYSLAPVQFKWTSETQPNIVEVEPPLGLINPGDYAELEVSVTGSKPGLLASSLQCRVEHLKEMLTLGIQATIAGPNVVINESFVNFGLVRLGNTAVGRVTLRNTTQLHALWTFQESEYFYRTAGLNRSELQITPDYGELAPLGEVDVMIKYTPEKTQTLSTVLDLEVKDGNSSNIAVTADVQTPQACFMECEVVVSDAFLSVPQVKIVALLNQTCFPTKYKFTEAKGKQTSDCQITVYPREGMLGPREKLELQVTFVCHSEGEVNSLLLPCYIEGQENPIVLGFYANVKPLSVAYSTPDSECDDLRVKYDDPVSLGSVVTKKVVFENLTAIRAPWSVSVEHFAAKPPAPPANKFDFKSANTRRAMLGRTPNLADPMAKTSKQTHKELCNLMLSSGLGAAFMVKPSRGFLDPYHTQVVEIEAYSNMWGSYKDTIICNIEGVPTKYIPLEMNVAGCPLIFQVVAGQEDKTAIVRFGTHINDGPQVRRKMKINNISPNDIRVDWKVFNTPEPTDSKLIDLNVWYGSAFPRLNPDGTETVPSLSNILRESFESENSTDDTPSPQTTPPRVVNVRIEPHFGRQSDSPFTIVPRQTVIPAHGHAIVSAMFTPVLGLDKENEPDSKEWSSFAHGYMTLDSKTAKIIPDKLSRLDGYSAPPLRMDMTAFVRRGSLRIEPDEDEDDEEPSGMKFKLSLGQMLLLSSRIGSEAVHHRHCTLINSTEMPLDFKLTITRPFFLSPTEPSNKNAKTPGKELCVESSARNRLKPQDNIRVKVGFRLSPSTLDDLRTLRNGELVPGARLLTDTSTGVESLVYSDNLAVAFSNGTNQLLPVEARVDVPVLRVSHTELDFGTCFVGQERCLQIKIENIGNSDSLWNACLDPYENAVNADCFRVEPSNGFLEGFVTHLAKNRMLLSVHFTPSCNEECSAVFSFSGVLGEFTRHLRVRGAGSYDGKYEIQ